MLLKAKRYTEAEQKTKTALKIFNKLTGSIHDIYSEYRVDAYKRLAELYKETKREIVRKLGITTVEYSRRVSAIREKVSGMAEADPVIEAVADEYGLTRSEMC